MKARILTVGLLAALALSVSIVGAQDDYDEDLSANNTRRSPIGSPRAARISPASTARKSKVCRRLLSGCRASRLLWIRWKASAFMAASWPARARIRCAAAGMRSRRRLQKLLTIDTDLATIIPNVAKGIDISDDQSTYTIHLPAKGISGPMARLSRRKTSVSTWRTWLGNESLTPGGKGPWGTRWTTSAAGNPFRHQLHRHFPSRLPDLPGRPG